MFSLSILRWQSFFFQQIETLNEESAEMSDALPAKDRP